MKRSIAITAFLLSACGSQFEGEPIVDRIAPPRQYSPELRLIEGERIILDGEEFVIGEPTVTYNDPSLEPVHAETPGTYGDVDKAFVVPSGYGHGPNSKPCTSEGTCRIPLAKQICIITEIDGEAPTETQQFAAGAARDLWIERIEAHGWSGTEDPIGCQFSTIGKILWSFDDLSDVGPGVLGLMTPIISTGDIAGRFQPWRHARVQIDPSSIRAALGYDLKTEEEKSRFTVNVVLHETLGHATGFSHRLGLLEPSPFDSWFDEILDLKASEYTMMETFQTD